MSAEKSNLSDPLSEGASSEPDIADLEFNGPLGNEQILWLDEGTLCVPYIPDFKVEELVFYFVPSLTEAREAYHGLPPRTLKRWSAYFTKKGWKFVHTRLEGRKGQGPYRVRPEKFGIEILDTGRFFLPKPQFRLGPEGRTIPVVSLEKRKPFDPWKPTYIRALNFIKKYEWIRAVPRAVEYAVWEIEECGEVAGSVSWENAERILAEVATDNENVQEVLVDIFEKRPEDFPLGSKVYLGVLGRAGDQGFQRVCAQYKNPQRSKRHHVAVVLGKLRETEGLETLLHLIEDEDVDVREAALCAIGKVGVPKGHPAEDRIRSVLEESEEMSHRVWAAEALFRGGDTSQEKTLIQFVKEMPHPLHDLGELGVILVELKLLQSVPFLINRLKSDRVELQDDAAEALREITGLDIEFHSHGDQTQRRSAIRQWNRWWEEYKRSRRKR